MPTILLVDDELVVCELIARMLRDGRHTVLCANSGFEALALLTADPAPDLLLLDVRMPEMTGPELAKKAAELGPGIAILFMSGFPEFALRQDWPQEAIPRFVMKPFSAAQLLDAVDQALASAQGR